MSKDSIEVPVEIVSFVEDFASKERATKDLYYGGYVGACFALYKKLTVEYGNEIAVLQSQILDYRKALEEIRDNSGGKLCREDRGRMYKIAFDTLNKYPSTK